jgi:uncharacterized protein YceK
MKSRKLLVATLATAILWTLSGCGSAGKHAAPSYGGAQPADTSYAQSTASYEADAPASAAPAPMPADEAPAPARSEALGHEPRSARPAPVVRKERPGLGTVFGETRSSPVRHRPFDRASSRPFASLSVFYNDAEGVAAQMSYRGGEGASPYYARTPGGGITVSLQDNSGRVMHGRSAGGRTYVVGREGERYTVVLRNTTGGRYEVVASVDGLDVIDGKPASTVKRGYLLQPYGTLVIDGYRRSDSAVAAFRFGRVRDSYAARTTGDRNVGVIGVAFFGERGSEWTTDELRRRETADPFPVDTRYAAPPPAGS